MASPPHPLILIVEDEPAIASLLEAYLKRDGFRTDRAGTGTRALTLHRANRPELILLDVNLPDIDGFEVLRRIRDQSGPLGQTPVILVTAMAEDLEKLLGLRLGADDYVVKPFGPLEVVARVKAVLRRTRAAGPLPTVFRLGALEVDPVGMVVRAQGQRLDLTLSEYRLLEHLARHPNRTFARSELFAACLPESEALERVVDAHLGNVRKKLDQAGLTGLLETVRGVGYRLWVP